MTVLRSLPLLFLVCCALPAADLAAARKAEQAGNFAAAEAVYSEIVEKQPSAELYQRLGLVRHMQNKFDGAANAFEQAIKFDPNLWSSHLFLGIDRYRTNNFEVAYQHLAIADRLHPGEREIRFWLGAAQLARRDYLAGLTALESVLRDDPANADVLRLLAESYGDYGTKLLSEVAEESPNSPAGLAVQGKAFEFEGSYAAALSAYRAALAADPGRPGLRESIAHVESLAAAKPAKP